MCEFMMFVYSCGSWSSFVFLMIMSNCFVGRVAWKRRWQTGAIYLSFGFWRKMINKSQRWPVFINQITVITPYYSFLFSWYLPFTLSSPFSLSPFPHSFPSLSFLVSFPSPSPYFPLNLHSTPLTPSHSLNLLPSSSGHLLPLSFYSSSLLILRLLFQPSSTSKHYPPHHPTLIPLPFSWSPTFLLLCNLILRDSAKSSGTFRSWKRGFGEGGGEG